MVVNNRVDFNAAPAFTFARAHKKQHVCVVSTATGEVRDTVIISTYTSWYSVLLRLPYSIPGMSQ